KNGRSIKYPFWRGLICRSRQLKIKDTESGQYASIRPAYPACSKLNLSSDVTESNESRVSGWTKSETWGLRGGSATMVRLVKKEELSVSIPRVIPRKKTNLLQIGSSINLGMGHVHTQTAEDIGL